MSDELTDGPVGRGDALVDALTLYKRLLFEGCVHSLMLRAGGREHNAWELSWQVATTNYGDGRADEWMKVSIVQNDLHVLGRFALMTLQAYEANAPQAAI